MSNLKYLYHFTSMDLDLIEVKRLDQEDSAPLSEIYKWLIVSNKTQKIFELDFKAMNKSFNNEEREFIEGNLQFDDKEATLSLLGKKFELVRKEVDVISELSIGLIQRYLSQKLAGDEFFFFRQLKPSDVEYFKSWVFDSEVIRYSMTKFHRINDSFQVMEWFYTTLFDPKTFQLGLADRKTKALIGYAGIAGLNEVDGNGEYFIFIGDKSYWGKGIASKATRKIVQHGFQNLNLHRIFLTASSRKPGAIRAYKKAGFVHEGKMREAFYRNNEYSDKIVMGILKREFELNSYE